MQAGTKSTVHYAIGANLVVALAKAAAAVLSGSAAMVAETAHSFADTGNQVLLRVSLSKAEQPADEEHPFGYGRERFFWALLVAVMVFVVGALVSVGEGVIAIVAGGETSFAIAYAVLAVALVAETISFARAVTELRTGAHREGWSVNRYVRRSTDPTVRTVLFEDAAAIAGVLIAAAGIAGHQLTGARVWEGVSSIAIGVLLAAVALTLGKNSKDLIIGQPADPAERATIENAIAEQPEVAEILALRTVHLGPEHLFVGIHLRFRDDLTTREIEDATNRITRELRTLVPDTREVFLDLGGESVAMAGQASAS